MPKPSQIHREIKAPPELVAAADVALDTKILPRKATEMLKYLIYIRAIARAKGNENEAARTLGMSRSALNQAVALLETRLA